MTRKIERPVDEDDRYTEARDAALRELEHGFALGGGPLPGRDDIHDIQVINPLRDT